MKTLITFTLFTLSLAAQTIVNPPAFTVDAPSTAAINGWLATIYKDGTTPTTLTAPIDAVQTTITVASGQGLGSGSVISVGVEHMTVTARTGGTLTVTRGHNGTTPAAANAGVTVGELKFKTMAALARDIEVQSFRQIAAQAMAKAAIEALNAKAKADSDTGIQ